MKEAVNSVEELIAQVLDDISTKGYSSVQPFIVGEVEERMVEYAEINGKRYIKIETDCNRD
jgi:hypothetical protein